MMRNTEPMKINTLLLIVSSFILGLTTFSQTEKPTEKVSWLIGI